MFTALPPRFVRVVPAVGLGLLAFSLSAATFAYPQTVPQRRALANPLVAKADVTRAAPSADVSHDTHSTSPSLAAGAAQLQPATIDAVIDRVIARERQTINTLRQFTPRVETYIQLMRPDLELGSVPRHDLYFFGRVDLHKRVDEANFVNSSFSSGLNAFGFRYRPAGFVQMMLLDANSFDRQHYQFAYRGREFVGDVRCVVFDVSPRKGAGHGRFLGRIWAEDQDFAIVRFNGTYANPPRMQVFLHFDSWRTNVQPGMWLPSIIYSQESDRIVRKGLFFQGRLRYKAQTRFWGYKLSLPTRPQEYTNVIVESPEVKDESQQASDLSPLESQALWEKQAQDNVLERMERAGLLAPDGPVDKVLETVVNNLMLTNNLNIPDVHCRVLMTTPFESFTVGRTIVVSRGLIDVLPDEASLAMVLARELAHLALWHRFDTTYAFYDRVMFDDTLSFARLNFRHNEYEESEADKTALEYLKNSPYKDSLSRAGLFLRQLDQRAPALRELSAARLGDSLVASGHVDRLTELMDTAPQLQTMRVSEVAALQLGARVRIDPWSDDLELITAKPVAIVAARQKMPLEVTPLMPHLTRLIVPENQTAMGAGR